MDFLPLPISKLDLQHPEYQQLAPVWRTIDTLRLGFSAIKHNAEKYLPKRPVEDDELYMLRLAKLAYSPVMAHIVHTYTGKMAMAGVEFPDKVDPIWSEIRGSNASPSEVQRDEVTFISELLTNILYFGRCFVMVDVPEAATRLRSKLELHQSKLIPYFTTIAPLDVINWGDGWYIYKQFSTESVPFSDISSYVTYTYVGDGVVAKYKIPVQIALAEDGELNKYPEVNRIMYKGEWQKPEDGMLCEPTSIVYGVGTDRLVKVLVSEDKWLCNSIYNKQIQHLRIENAWTDAGYLSGTVQRVFTPPDPVANDDPRVSYDNANVAQELAKAGNQHILIGKGYSFVESSGTALGNLEQMLDKIEAQILKIANLAFASGDKSALEQSGVSKKLDMNLLEGTLQEYGNILRDTYNTLLAKVAQLLLVAPVEVSGLSDFSEVDPEPMLVALQTISTLNGFPQMAKVYMIRKLLREMELVLTDADNIVLEKQLLEIPDTDIPDPLQPLPVK